MTVSFHKFGDFFPGTGDIKVNNKIKNCNRMTTQLNNHNTKTTIS